MSQPRYAPAGFVRNFKGFSLRGTLYATLLLALAVLLGLPALQGTGDRAAAAGPAPQTAHAAAAPDQPAAIDSLIEQAGIRPSSISTAQPAVPGQTKPKVKPVSNDGLIGPAGETGELGIPALVLQAYKQSAAAVDAEQPSCHLPWWLLAGIGHTESGHAESGRLYADGTTRGRILGPRLNGGIVGDAVISDTDHGRYDGDVVYDRAVGPMQFIPSTWQRWGADGNHDGKRDPNNIFDATLAAGRYLCAGGRNLATTPGLQAAVLSYNHSQPYLDTVLAWGYAYRSGASSLPDQSIPVVGDVTKVRPPLGAKPPHKPVELAKPKPKTSDTPTHSGTPTHSPAPTRSISASPTGTAGPSCTARPTGSATSSAPATSTKAGSQPAGGASTTATAAAIASADGNSATTASSGRTPSGSPSSSPTSSCTR